MSKNSIQIAIADDHPPLVVGLRHIINSFNNCTVIIEAYNGEQLLSAIETSRIQPTICILDINMPILDGYDTLKIIKQRWPDIYVVILTMHYNEFTIIKTFRDGACACLPKEASPEELEKAIDGITKRGFYHSELTAQSLYKLSHNTSAVSRINDRELEFLKYCTTDLSYAEIAKKMSVSARTVDNYRDKLFEILNLKSRTTLAIFAIKSGLII